MSRHVWGKLHRFAPATWQHSHSLAAVLLLAACAIWLSSAALAQQPDSIAVGDGHHHHHHGSVGGGSFGGGNFSSTSFGSPGFSARSGSGGWNRSWRGTNTSVTVIAPGYFSSFGVGGFYPGWSSPAWGWGGWNGWGGPIYRPGWGTGFFPYPYVLPPVVLPAGEMYGPRALWNQLGINADGAILGSGAPNAGPFNGQGPLILPDPPAEAQVAQRPNPAAVVPAMNPQPAAPPVVAARPIKLRKSNDSNRVRAMRLVAVADADFRAQKYVEAASRYRRAAQTAPDLPEAHFRQAQAEIALSHYDKAAKSCKLGLDADPAWIASGFRLANLYGPNQAAKSAHIEQLAQEAAAKPQDSDLRFLIGIELFLDGQLERSRKFFEQAAALNAGDDAHLLTFLRELDKQAPVERAGAVDL